MSRFNFHRWRSALAVAVMSVMAVGCDGCESVPSSTTDAPAPDDVAGMWLIADYGSDEEGCHPEDATSSINRLQISTVAHEQEATSPAEHRIDIRPCLSAEACSDEVTPENELFWNADYDRAEQTYHFASPTQTSPVEIQCRLSTIRTLLIPDGSELELTRSHYSIDLPIEGDEACNSELAEQYHANMECTRSEVFHLVAPDDDDDDDDPPETS